MNGSQGLGQEPMLQLGLFMSFCCKCKKRLLKFMKCELSNLSRIKILTTLIFLVSFVLLCSSVFASEIKPSFLLGERLEYSLSWYNINAGNAVMKIGDTGNSLTISSVARTNKFFSLFFKVDDRVETHVDRERLVPTFLMINQKEGRRRRRKQVIFDQENHKAFVKDFRKKKVKESVSDIPPFSHNSLSAFYSLRLIESFNPGESIIIDVHEGGKNWKLEIKVLKKEKLRTGVGEFNAVKLQAKVMFEGLFMDKGDVYIWLSDDERRLPLKIYCKISFGKVVARLIKID